MVDPIKLMMGAACGDDDLCLSFRIGGFDLCTTLIALSSTKKLFCRLSTGCLLRNFFSLLCYILFNFLRLLLLYLFFAFEGIGSHWHDVVFCYFHLLVPGKLLRVRLPRTNCLDKEICRRIWVYWFGLLAVG